ncbi:carbamoyltransferase HypF [Caproiciproducens faecalis]|uniref:Carbamoyltransferase n=1 Tax=Caproiciproducens faecalis TaxID=2820301 RepID=A0ABS7DJB2_9FIRM|nr:carbamoyltransferase HypF [Caproiciproducens faecalis]MBW7571380.1 carbamoyltransferase HypF [Caproiciproducens faecalis]
MNVFVTVSGIVQGVGYRPFVAGLAHRMGISGTVRNSGGIVEIAASGEKQRLEEFLYSLQHSAPDGAQVINIRTEPMPEQQFDGFSILKSGRAAKKETEPPMIPPDLPMCDECRKELYSSKNRRRGYPFISCASCGPRYSIMNTLPYDRETTTMKDFTMCPDCAREYRDGRRRHAQTISCHSCGPQLHLLTGGMTLEKQDALEQAITLLKNGTVLAVKGVGGYQFVCSPYQEDAVERLRLLKGREKKPFAVMFPNLERIREVCNINKEEEKLLLSMARPIVLLNKDANVFCSGVCGESRFLGAFLPCTGLHQLLTDACGPLIVTSGNFTNEPIIYRDDDMMRSDTPYLSGILYNTRRIVTPLDDSVARVACSVPQILRRSRGYAPLPVVLEQRVEHPVLAMGGDLKSSFCLLSGDRAYLSQYFGDLENYSVYENYKFGLKHMEQLLMISPQQIACDLHPGYQSGLLAQRIVKDFGLGSPVFIQHHHAHAASVMAEHRLDGCIGVVFDGTGYGTDGTIWGGEFLLCSGSSFERRAHLSRVLLCGGDAAAKNAVLTSDCYRFAAGEESGSERFPFVKAALRHQVNTQESSSAGRLFDAVCAILGIKEENSYEGECAIALENAAAAAKGAGEEPIPFHLALSQNSECEWEADQADFIRQLLQSVAEKQDKNRIALGFHVALAEMVAALCKNIREESGENRVALSGGVFANLLLLQDCRDRLTADGFQVYLNSAVPSNDGGICLGQAWICAQAENSREKMRI